MQHNQAKIALSKDEMELIANAEILLTKNEIIRKVVQLFASVAEEYVALATNKLPVEVLSINPKISKGENYEGLPYVMLDYPRYFKKENTFAIRTFFWWGNFFSLTIQLSGVYKQTEVVKLQQALEEDVFAGWFINVTDQQWDHHFRKSNYQSIDNKVDLLSKNIIKLSTKIPLEKWDDVEYFLRENFSKILKVLSS